MEKNNWRILIVDDEPIVHKVTKLVLKNFVFDGREIEFTSAYSAKEAKLILKNSRNIALVLLDVVMEEKDSGLKLVRYIREELQNKLIRIVIRTGHPGEAPEDKIILNYDINDYRDKTDVTSNKLFSTIVSSLRSYRDMNTIINHNKGLNQIINSSSFISGIHDNDKFIESFSRSLSKLLKNYSHNEVNNIELIVLKPENKRFRIFYQYQNDVENYDIDEYLEEDSQYFDVVQKTLINQSSLNEKNIYSLQFSSNSSNKYVLIIKFHENCDDWTRNIIEISLQNARVAFENLSLNKEIIETQREIILRLGEIIEHRSLETGFHVKRMAEYAYLIAKKYGLPDESCDTLRMAAPMHDLGKVAISDSILNKPDTLTDDEYEIMKTHTTIGYDLLRSSGRDLLKKAAIIAFEHHEKYDGTGYPNRKSGNDIHIFGRISAIADVFDALASDRVYRKAWDLNDILQYLKDQRGKQFDPEIVDIFFNNLSEILSIKEKYTD